jgi:hypothetical protein
VALPSVVTIGSLAFVVAAGVGYAATLSASASPSSPPASQSSTSHIRFPAAVKPIPTPQHASSTPPKHRPDVIPHVLVVVYNNTGITGLAASKAAILEGAGWNVASTDNWYGSIPANTVYFPPQMRPAAAKLAKVLHITRLRPAVSPMQFDRLTVILATG